MKYVASEYVEKKPRIIELDNDTLQDHHDHMHIYWKKVEEGQEFGWTFKEVYILHKLIVIEMLKRGLDHFHPINELDNVRFFSNEAELLQVIDYIKNSE